MVIEKDRVVTLDYVLKDEGGEVLDSSEKDDPLVYIHGRGNIIPGLEKELDGKKAGDKIHAVIKPADAYGEYNEELVAEVPKSNFGEDAEIEVGMQFEANDGEASHIVTVTDIANDLVTIDANHPLAGVELHFDVSVVDIREPTEEERAHGHIHQACGCGGDCDDDCEDGCGDGKQSGGCGCGGCH